MFLGIKAVGPVMCEKGRGSIINISSVAGLKGTAGTIAYSASKWAVRGMTKCAANEYASFGVRVNSIHPGIIDTPMAEPSSSSMGRSGTSCVRRSRWARKPVRSRSRTWCCILASDDSSYSTGSEFVVDGGMVAR